MHVQPYRPLTIIGLHVHMNAHPAVTKVSASRAQSLRVFFMASWRLEVARASPSELAAGGWNPGSAEDTSRKMPKPYRRPVR